MHKMILFLLCLIFLIVPCFAHDYQVKDSVGAILVLKKPAQRIISLAPNITEIVYAAGAGDRLVGVSNFSDYPEQAKKIPVVAMYYHLDIEKILWLHPDLVIAWREGNPPQELRKLRQLGIPVYMASFEKINDIPRVVKNIALLADRKKIGNQFSKSFIKQYRQLKQHYSSKKKVPTFYQLSEKPLLTLNNSSLISQIILLCGGENIFGNTFASVPRVSIPSVLHANPKVILISGQISQHQQWKKTWKEYNQISAVKNEHVFAINSDTLERYGPRLLLGALQVCRDIDLARDV